jgi:outer membrane biosynthesis protein TonB
VKLRLRVDRLGRIDSYEVAKQAPDGVFEHAVAAALFKARLPPDPDAAPLR